MEYQKPEALTLYDYPPRVIFEMIPSVNCEPCIFQLHLTGMTKDVDFQLPLRVAKHCIGKTCGKFAAFSNFMLSLSHKQK